MQNKKPLSKEELIKTITKNVGVSDPSWKFDMNEKGELVGTLNLVDTKWIQFFAKAGLRKTIKLIIRFDETKHRAMYITEYGTVQWKLGVPETSWDFYKHRGQVWGWQMGRAYGIKNDGSLGEIYNYKVNFTNVAPEIKKVIEKNGWKWVRDFNDWSTRIATFFAVIGGVGTILIVILALLGLLD